MHSGRLITVFSATNYCGTANNAGAILVLGRDLTLYPKLIHPLPPSALYGSGGEDEEMEVPVWNGTVANLTLMALGSSAPEICLAVIGVVGNNFESDALGPGTIVGSAAYNLLAISAVCVFAIPDGGTRR